MLYHVGAHTVLPGLPVLRLPQTAAGEEDKGQKITTDNRVLFHPRATRSTTSTSDRPSCPAAPAWTSCEVHLKISSPAAACSTSTSILMEKGVKLEGVGGVKYVTPRAPAHADETVVPGHQRWPTAEWGARDLSDRCWRVRHARGGAPISTRCAPQAGRDREGAATKLRGTTQRSRSRC